MDDSLPSTDAGVASYLYRMNRTPWHLWIVHYTHYTIAAPTGPAPTRA